VASASVIVGCWRSTENGKLSIKPVWQALAVSWPPAFDSRSPPGPDRGAGALLSPTYRFPVFNRFEHRVRIHEFNPHVARLVLSNHDIAREQQPDGGFLLDGAVLQPRVACAKDAVRRHVPVEPRLIVAATSMSVRMPKPSRFSAFMTRSTVSAKGTATDFPKSYFVFITFSIQLLSARMLPIGSTPISRLALEPRRSRRS
jgi:hypothetical protein